MKKGVLTLIPTPIDESSPLETTAKELLLNATNNQNSIFVVEDLKPGRRRWIRWGLPRETVNQFHMYNEHNAKEAAQQLLTSLTDGKNVFLMSDGGLPAFCDPGIELVDLCHRKKIKVTSTPFPNSVALALSLSGLNHNKFNFEGFLPIDKSMRKKVYLSLAKSKRTSIIMDTPYRLKRCLEELSNYLKNREIFLAINLNDPEQELLLRDKAFNIINELTDYKHEFIIVIPGS